MAIIRSLFLTSISAIVLSIASYSHAQSNDIFSAFQEQKQVAKTLPDLTKNSVKKWISAYKSIQKLDLPEIQQAVKGENDSAADVMQSLQESKHYAKLMSIVKSAGFSDVEQWTQVGMQVMQGYAAITVDKKSVNQQLQNSIAEIRSNAALSEQQKQFMINMTKQAGGMVDTLTDAPEANKRAVKAYQGQLQQLLDDK